MIRCKRCFKKYDGHDPECSRCGRLNEYDDENIGFGKKACMDETNRKSTFKNYICLVCGKNRLTNSRNCPSCYNSNIVSKSNKTSHTYQHTIDCLFDGFIRKSRGKVDMLAWVHEAESINLLINTWEAPHAFEYGKRTTAKSLFIVFSSFSFLSMFRLFDTIEEALPFFVIMLLVTLVILWHKRKSCVSGIVVSKLTSHEASVITYFKEDKGKKGEDVFKIWSFDLETIDLVIKEGNQLQSVRFVEKINEKGDQTNHQVYPIGFSDTHDFIKVIWFFCFKYNIDLYIKDEVVSSKISDAIN